MPPATGVNEGKIMIQFDVRARSMDQAVSDDGPDFHPGDRGYQLQRELEEMGATPDMAVEYMRENYDDYAGLITVPARFRHRIRSDHFRKYLKNGRVIVKNICTAFMRRYRELRDTGADYEEILISPDNPYKLPYPVIADLLLKIKDEETDEWALDAIEIRLQEIKEDVERVVRARPFYLEFLYHLNRASLKE